MESSGSILLLGNPYAGKFSHQLLEQIRTFFERRGMHVIPLPGAEGRLDEIKPINGSTRLDAVVLVGGDGTVNRCINEFGPAKVPLGIIPAGTGNVLARELGIPIGDPHKAAQVVLSGHKRRVDLGLLNNKYFVLMAGVGFDGYVSLRLPVTKHGMGLWSYVLATIKAYLKFRPSPIVVKTGDKILSGETILICNARLYGGPLCFACYAEMDDGLLDIIVFGKMGVVHVLKYLLMGSGIVSLGKSASVSYITAKNAEIISHGPMPVQMDGEFYGTTPVRVSVVPRCQEFFVPP